MTDHELASHVESKLSPVGETLRHNLAYLREARQRFADPGRRVPVPGRPTFTEWIRQNIGISDRHVRRLLAGPKESADRSGEGEMEQTQKQGKRDEMMWQAGRLAHAVLGLDEPDERDPSGIRRRAALTAMAYRFLGTAHRKHIPVIVRVRALQPADIHELSKMILMCFEVQVDQVFKTLAGANRREALRLFAREFASRYDG